MNLVVLSGGLDSTVCMALAAREAREGAPLTALTFDYGQRHRVELGRAAAVAASYRAEHVVVPLDLSGWGGSALTDAGIDVPKPDNARFRITTAPTLLGRSDAPITASEAGRSRRSRLRIVMFLSSDRG